jgi:hypothetical protein
LDHDVHATLIENAVPCTAAPLFPLDVRPPYL